MLFLQLDIFIKEGSHDTGDESKFVHISYTCTFVVSLTHEWYTGALLIGV